MSRPDSYRPQHPPPRVSWWATPQAQQSREVFREVASEQAERMNETSTNQHVNRKQGDK